MPTDRDPAAPLPQSVQAVLDTAPGRVGLAVLGLKSGERFARGPDEVFAQASAIKIPVLWALERAAVAGELSLDEALAVDPGNGAGGCGELQHFQTGASRLALGDLAVLMIVRSDNVATNLLIDRVTPEAVNRLLESEGVEQTRLRRKMMDHAAHDAGQENTATPAEAVHLMASLYAHSQSGDPAAERALATLLIKKSSPVGAALPRGVRLANKPGQLAGLRTEWAIVDTDSGPYALALMAEGPDDAALKSLLGNLTEAVHAHMVTAAG